MTPCRRARQAPAFQEQPPRWPQSPTQGSGFQQWSVCAASEPSPPRWPTWGPRGLVCTRALMGGSKAAGPGGPRACHDGVVSGGREPALLACTVLVRKAPILEAQFAHAKVRLEGISSLRAFSCSTGDTNGQTQLEGHRALAYGSRFPEGSAEVPGACRDARCVMSGPHEAGSLSVHGKNWRETEAREARGWPQPARRQQQGTVPAPHSSSSSRLDLCAGGPLSRGPSGRRAGPERSVHPVRNQGWDHCATYRSPWH